MSVMSTVDEKIAAANVHALAGTAIIADLLMTKPHIPNATLGFEQNFRMGAIAWRLPSIWGKHLPSPTLYVSMRNPRGGVWDPTRSPWEMAAEYGWVQRTRWNMGQLRGQESWTLTRSGYSALHLAPVHAARWTFELLVARMGTPTGFGALEAIGDLTWPDRAEAAYVEAVTPSEERAACWRAIFNNPRNI